MNDWKYCIIFLFSNYGYANVENLNVSICYYTFYYFFDSYIEIDYRDLLLFFFRPPDIADGYY